MELKIDTQKDSKEDIQRVIDFLQTFIAQQETIESPAITATHKDEPTPAMMTMFDITGPEEEPTTNEPLTNEPMTSEQVENESVADEQIKDEPEPSGSVIEQTPAVPETAKTTVTTTPEIKKLEKKETEKKEEVTKTSAKPSVAQILRDPLKILFKKNDSELDEVQRLKKASKTTSENLRIIAYK
jgi:hypothetical protein